MVEAVASINKGKADILTFFRGAGVPQRVLADLEARVQADRNSLSKVEIARTVLERINAGADELLAARRGALRRVVEFEAFGACWPNERDKAEASVRRLRELVEHKDTVRRLERERETRERDARAREQAERGDAARRQAEERAQILADFAAVARDPNAQRRGKSVEGVVAAMFRHAGIELAEDFQRRSDSSGAVVEQVDGVVRVRGQLVLVEIKWLKAPVGRPDLSPHLVSLFNRFGASGLFVSASGYSEAAILDAKLALSQRRVALLEMMELIAAFEAAANVEAFIEARLHAAQMHLDPRASTL